MKPLRIYLADLTYTTLSLATEAFPLNVGFVASYCKSQFGNQVDIHLFKYIEDLEEAIRDCPPDIMGLSNYPWNLNIGLCFFKLLEEISPDTLRVMGGPNIPLVQPDQEQFIIDNDLIDFYVYLEGEQSFSNIVERVLSKGTSRKAAKQDPINGAMFLNEDKEVVRGDWLPRRKELDEIPSPYLNGFMDKFFDGILSPMLETNRGCPFTCTFCHEGNSLLTKVNYFSLDRVFAELDYVAKKVPEQVTNLLFADPNFAMYERDFEICEHIARIQKKQNWPRSIFASTGKNKKERIAKALRTLNGSMKLWMSVQSMDENVLKEIKRQNIKLDAMMGLTEVFEEMNLPTYSELILALPGDTYERHLNSISALVDSGIDLVSTYSLMLLNGTELTLEKTRQKYGIKTHFRVLPRDFGKLSNGDIAVEIEEIVTSNNTMSFDDYVNLRVIHLLVNVVYNQGALKPLFRFLATKTIPASKLLSVLESNLSQAPKSVQGLVESFRQDTIDELWESKDELHEFMTKEENYEKLCSGELGANLIQTYVARSLHVMQDWTTFVFTCLKEVIDDSELDDIETEMLNNVKDFCLARVHNIWGEDRNKDNPSCKLEYDISSWTKAPKNTNLNDYKYSDIKSFTFCFSPEQQHEMQSYLDRFGNTPTGIGRILTKVAVSSIWRQQVESSL